MMTAALLLAQVVAPMPAATPAASPAPVAAASPAPWTPVERPGQTPGTGSVSAAATAPGGRLVVRCDRVGTPVLSIQFIPRERLRGFGQQPVSLRFDGGTPLIDNWELMGAGVIEREEHATATLAFGIAHAHAISLRTTNAAGAPLELSFTGPASDAAIRRVVDACGRPLALPAPPAPSPPAPPPAAPPPS